MRWPTTTIALIAALAWAAPAAAQPAGDVAAEAVFEQGLAKFEQGDFEAACPLLARAVSLSKSEALGGTLTLAECYERTQRPASAWALYKRVAARAALTKQGDRAETAQRAADRLEPTLARARLSAGPKPPRGLRVRVGGESIPSDVWDVPLPVDPGSATFTFEADGLAPRTLTIEIPAGPSLTEVTAPELAALDAEAGAPATPPGAIEPAAGGLGPLGIAGIVSGAVGVAGMAASLGVILDAKSQWDDALARDCNGDPRACSTLAGLEDARAQGDIASAVFGVGVGLTALGASLLIVDLVRGPSTPARDEPVVAAGAAPGVAYGSLTWRL